MEQFGGNGAPPTVDQIQALQVCVFCRHNAVAYHEASKLHIQFTASFFGPASGRIFPVCWRTMTSQVSQHLALSKGSLPDACPKIFVFMTMQPSASCGQCPKSSCGPSQRKPGWTYVFLDYYEASADAASRAWPIACMQDTFSSKPCLCPCLDDSRAPADVFKVCTGCSSFLC